MTHAIEQDIAHRPWPLPAVPWILFQSWRELLFAHWRVDPERLRGRVPAPLDLDLFEGSAFVAVTPLRITDQRARGLPRIGAIAEFPELNLRTYVRFGGRAGVYFFSLDAASAAAVFGARTFYRLPYHKAEMRMLMRGGSVHFRSRREDGTAEFAARYSPTGDVFLATPGTLEHFLVERYALYTVLRSGRVLRTDIHHGPWMLRRAEADITVNTVAQAAGFDFADEPPHLLYSARQDTLIWAPRLVP